MDFKKYAYKVHWLGFVIIPLWFGIHKFLDPGFWAGYIAPQFANLLPFAPATFMTIVGVIELAVGLGVLTKKYRQLAASVATVWILLIALNLFVLGAWDIAVRDLGLAALAFTLACQKPK